MSSTSSISPSPEAPAVLRAPVLFLGHGSPMNALEDSTWSRSWRELGAALDRPRAILCISAHWYVDGTYLTGNAQPGTIHDFGGFPRALYELRYPAPGAPDLARRIVDLLGQGGRPASLRDDWGLDHGTWSVLLHLQPKADVPVLQLSLDRRLSDAQHLELGRALRPLRDQGVLLVASGNITHNLRDAFSRQDGATPPWARSFDADVARALEQRDAGFLTRVRDTAEGRLAHPSPDHYLPLLYALGSAEDDEVLSFPTEGFDYGSLSMRSCRFG